MEEAGGVAVHFKHAPPFLRKGIVKALGGHRHAGAVAKETHSLHKVQMFHTADKVDAFAPRPAAEAVIALRFGINGERRRFFAVERTQTDKVFSAPFQRHIGGYELFNVGAGPQLGQKIIAESRHGNHLRFQFGITGRGLRHAPKTF